MVKKPSSLDSYSRAAALVPSSSRSLTSMAAFTGRPDEVSTTRPASRPLAPGNGPSAWATGAGSRWAGASEPEPRNGLELLLRAVCFLPKRLQPVSPRQTISKAIPSGLRTAWPSRKGTANGPPFHASARSTNGPSSRQGDTDSQAILPAPPSAVKADSRRGTARGTDRAGTSGKDDMGREVGQARYPHNLLR